MTDDWDDNREKKRGLKGPLIGGLIVAAVGGGLWLLSQNIAGVTVPSALPTPTVNLLPPPPPQPPPPPPTKEPPPQPDRMDAPKPEDQPKADNQPKQLTIAGPAQAGGDSFGIGAGKGGGSSVIGGSGEGAGLGGGDFAEANYRRFLRSEIQQALQSDSRISRLFSTAVVAIWIDSDGHVRRSKIHRTTGDQKVDADIIAALREMPPLRDPPPAHFPSPTEVQIKGTRRG